MEALERARQLYKQRYSGLDSAMLDDQKNILDLERSFQSLLDITIKEVPSVNLFKTKGVFQILHSALESHSRVSTDLEALIKAFQSLEKYFLQIVEQPWKREFKKLKLYGGFYRTRVGSALPEAELLFQRAGYKHSRDGQLMSLECPGGIQTSDILDIAFDCMLCHEQCQNIVRHYEVVKSLSVSMEQAVSEVLYSDRSRGRPAPQPIPPPPMVHNDLPYNFSGSVSAYNKPLPPLPQYGNPISTSAVRANSSSLPSTAFNKEQRGVTDFWQGPNSIDRQGEHFKGTSDEHILRSIQKVVGPEQEFQHPVDPYLQSTMLRNGQSSNDEINYLYQMGQPQQLHPQQNVRGVVPNNRGIPHGSIPSNSVRTTGHLVPMFTPEMNARRQGQNIAPSMSNTGTSNDLFFDEGIDMTSVMNLSSPKHPLSSHPRIPSETSTATHPRISNHSIQQSSLIADQGYNTALVSNGQFLSASSNGVYTDRNKVMLQGPPPIPPRSLKPTEGVKNLAFHDNLSNSTSSSLTASTASVEARANAVGVSMGGAVDSFRSHGGMVNSAVISNGKTLHTLDSPVSALSASAAPTMRRHLLLNKASSLKCPNNGSVQKSSRAVKSMDFTRVLLDWQCHRCTALNTSSNNVCSVCSASRLSTAMIDADCVGKPSYSSFTQEPMPGDSKKPCPKCTYENDPSLKSCEMCGGELQDPYTYV